MVTEVVEVENAEICLSLTLLDDRRQVELFNVFKKGNAWFDAP
jgi:hypothetical protein